MNRLKTDNNPQTKGQNMVSYFMRFSIEMTKDQALSASHQGECYDDAKALCNIPKIKRQLNKISYEDLQGELREYGAWEKDELIDHEENQIKIIWIAACNIIEIIKSDK